MACIKNSQVEQRPLSVVGRYQGQLDITSLVLLVVQIVTKTNGFPEDNFLRQKKLVVDQVGRIGLTSRGRSARRSNRFEISTL